MGEDRQRELVVALGHEGVTQGQEAQVWLPVRGQGPAQPGVFSCVNGAGTIVLGRGSVKSKCDDAYTAVSTVLGTY